MAWSQLGTMPYGISVQTTTNKDDMTHIRIIHWFSQQHIYNRQAWLLENKNHWTGVYSNTHYNNIDNRNLQDCAALSNGLATETLSGGRPGQLSLL